MAVRLVYDDGTNAVYNTVDEAVAQGAHDQKLGLRKVREILDGGSSGDQSVAADELVSSTTKKVTGLSTLLKKAGL
jgi:hypothetical protein